MLPKMLPEQKGIAAEFSGKIATFRGSTRAEVYSVNQKVLVTLTTFTTNDTHQIDV